MECLEGKSVSLVKNQWCRVIDLIVFCHVLHSDRPKQYSCWIIDLFLQVVDFVEKKFISGALYFARFF